MDSKGHSNELSDANEEHVITNWRKDDPCYNVPKKLANLFSCFVKGRICEQWTYLTEANFKQSVEGTTWVLLTAYDEMWKDRNYLKMNC